MSKMYKTSSPEETKNIGKHIAVSAQPGAVFLLAGELGAGKTTLVKGMAEGLGISEDIVSPTFTLMNLYTIKHHTSKMIHLIHIDTYRLKNADELIAIGALDYIGAPDTVTVIEWPERILPLLTKLHTTSITLEHDADEIRRITIDE